MCDYVVLQQQFWFQMVGVSDTGIAVWKLSIWANTQPRIQIQIEIKGSIIMTSSFNIPPPFGTKSRACLERHGIYLRKPANLFWTFRMFRKGLRVVRFAPRMFVISVKDIPVPSTNIGVQLLVTPDSWLLTQCNLACRIGTVKSVTRVFIKLVYLFIWGLKFKLLFDVFYDNSNILIWSVKKV